MLSLLTYLFIQAAARHPERVGRNIEGLSVVELLLNYAPDFVVNLDRYQAIKSGKICVGEVRVCEGSAMPMPRGPGFPQLCGFPFNCAVVPIPFNVEQPNLAW